jgi:hypothetical protein
MTARIHLSLTRPNGHRSTIEVSGEAVTPAMLDAAEDLITTLTSGERALPKELYDVCARAFGTTREDAKGRICAAMYGAKKPAVPTAEAASAADSLSNEQYYRGYDRGVATAVGWHHQHQRGSDAADPGWTWRAHFDELHANVCAKQWLRASKTLALMLSHVLGKAEADKAEADHASVGALISELSKSLNTDQIARLRGMLDLSQTMLLMEILTKGNTP